MRWWWCLFYLCPAAALPIHGLPSQPLSEPEVHVNFPAVPLAPELRLHHPLPIEPLETTTRFQNSVRQGHPQLPVAIPVDKSVDLDGNGELNLPEVQYAAFVHHGLSASVVEHLFKQIDSDHDGVLSAVEFNNIRPLVIEKAENAALRYMQSVDLDKNKLLSLQEAQAYLLKEYGIGHRDVERIWRMVEPDTEVELTPTEFAKLRRRIRGMTIRLARQVMKSADTNGDGHISLDEAQAVAFEQEGIGAGDVTQMMASVDDNQDGELNAPEFADFQRIVRARAVDTSRKALKVVDADNSGTVTMDEARRIAYEHYGFDEDVLTPFFDQADENEDGQLDPVEFAGFRTVIRSRAVKNAVAILRDVDLDGDGFVNLEEAAEKTRAEDDMDNHETRVLFNIADQNKSGKLDKVEFADFLRLVRLSAIRFAADHFKEFDRNGDGVVGEGELAGLIQAKYGVSAHTTADFFRRVDVDASGDLIPAEIVDFRHAIRKYVAAHGGLSSAYVESSGDGEPTASEEPQRTEKPRTTTATTTTATTTTTGSTTTTHEESNSISTAPLSVSSSSSSSAEATTRRKVAFHRKPQTAGTTTTTVVTTTVKEEAEEDLEPITMETPATKKRAVWKHWNKTTTTTSQPATTLDEEAKEERRRLIEKQKKELNLPPETEVEYLEGDQTTKSPDEYEVVEYVDAH